VLRVTCVGKLTATKRESSEMYRYTHETHASDPAQRCQPPHKKSATRPISSHARGCLVRSPCVAPPLRARRAYCVLRHSPAAAARAPPPRPHALRARRTVPPASHSVKTARGSAPTPNMPYRRSVAQTARRVRWRRALALETAFQFTPGHVVSVWPTSVCNARDS